VIIRIYVILASLLLSSCACRAQKEPLRGSFSPTDCEPPLCVQLNLDFKKQETPLWCWAAAGEMVMDPKVNVDQCDEANKVLQLQVCCNGSPADACIQGGFPPFADYNFTSMRTYDQALSWETIKAEIDAGRPVVFSWHWNQDGGHMMVIIGYREGENDHARKLRIFNPEKDATVRLYSYAFYVEGTDHTHWDDFYDIQH